MIKLFGWEKRISDRIKESRENELVWLRKLTVRRVTWSMARLIPYTLRLWKW